MFRFPLAGSLEQASSLACYSHARTPRGNREIGAVSVQAITWAFAQDIRPASRKFVLVSLANFSGSEDGICFPSNQALCDCTGLDRKTVIEALDDLESTGYIEDTKKRRGATAQVKVYRLKGFQNRNSSATGTVPKTEAKSPVFPEKESRFSRKESQKRDTEPSGTVQEPSVNRQGESDRALRMKATHELRQRANALFKRKDNAPWGCEEEHALVEVASRPDCLSEMADIEAFFARGDYLPQTLKKLMVDWTNVLDRARNLDANMKRNKPEKKSLIDQEMDELLRRANALR